MYAMPPGEQLRYVADIIVFLFYSSECDFLCIGRKSNAKIKQRIHNFTSVPIKKIMYLVKATW